MSAMSSGVAVTFLVSALFVVYASLLHLRGPFSLYRERGSMIAFRLWSSFTCLPIMMFIISFELLLLCRPGFFIVGVAFRDLSLWTGLGVSEIIGISISTHLILLYVMHRICENITVGDYVEKYELMSSEIEQGTFHKVVNGHAREECDASVTRTMRLCQTYATEFIGFLALISAMFLYLF